MLQALGGVNMRSISHWYRQQRQGRPAQAPATAGRNTVTASDNLTSRSLTHPLPSLPIAENSIQA